VATTTYSDVELERLRGFPNSIAPDELIRFFTLTTGDIAFVNGHRTSPSRIGVAVQLCMLPCWGSCPTGSTVANFEESEFVNRAVFGEGMT